MINRGERFTHPTYHETGRRELLANHKTSSNLICVLCHIGRLFAPSRMERFSYLFVSKPSVLHAHVLPSLLLNLCICIKCIYHFQLKKHNYFPILFCNGNSTSLMLEYLLFSFTAKVSQSQSFVSKFC